MKAVIVVAILLVTTLIVEAEARKVTSDQGFEIWIPDGTNQLAAEQAQANRGPFSQMEAQI